MMPHAGTEDVVRWSAKRLKALYERLFKHDDTLFFLFDKNAKHLKRISDYEMDPQYIRLNGWDKLVTVVRDRKKVISNLYDSSLYTFVNTKVAINPNKHYYKGRKIDTLNSLKSRAMLDFVGIHYDRDAYVPVIKSIENKKLMTSFAEMIPRGNYIPEYFPRVADPFLFRDGTVMEWIRGNKSIVWDDTNQNLFSNVNPIRRQISPIFNDLMKYNLENVYSKMLSIKGKDYWYRNMISSFDRLGKEGKIEDAAEKIINVYKYKGMPTQDRTYERTRRAYEDHGKENLALNFMNADRKMFDFLLNEYKDKKVVEYVIRSIYLERGLMKHIENNVVPAYNKDIDKKKILPITAREIEQWLFKREPGKNLNEDLHHEILKEMYKNKKINFRLSCDATELLVRMEVNLHPENERDPHFMRLAKNNISRMKREGRC